MGTLTTVLLIFHYFNGALNQLGNLLHLHGHRLCVKLKAAAVRTLLRTQDFVTVYPTKHECGFSLDDQVAHLAYAWGLLQ